MQTPFCRRLEDQPSGRVDTPQQLRGANTVQDAASWLREKGRDDDNYDGKQWWEESDSEPELDDSPTPSPVVIEQAPTEHDSQEGSTVEAMRRPVARHPGQNVSDRWQEHRSKVAYVEHVEDLDIMPAPLRINKREPTSRKPVPVVKKPSPPTPDKPALAVNKASPCPGRSTANVDKPLPALPDMRITGEMANGVRILSLSDAQARQKANRYGVPVIDPAGPRESTTTSAAPQVPIRRGTTKRLLDGISKLTKSTLSSQSAQSTLSSTEPPHPPAQAAPTPPTPRSPTVVGSANRVTQWLDFMEVPEYHPSPSRPAAPPSTAEAHCHCPEHRAERAAA